MEDCFVQFTDKTEKTILSVFGCEQNTTEWENQGVVCSDDIRYLKFLEALPNSPVFIRLQEINSRVQHVSTKIVELQEVLDVGGADEVIEQQILLLKQYKIGLLTLKKDPLSADIPPTPFDLE